MIVIHEEPELTAPFDIKSDPRRRQDEPRMDEPKLLETVMDRFWWVTLGYVGTVLIKAIVMLG